MDPSRAGDLGERQTGSDLPPVATSVPAAEHDEAGGAMTVHTPSALRESEKQAWPEWARAGDPTGRGLEPRRTSAGDTGVSQTIIGWSPWRGRSRSPSPAVTVPLGAATVVAIAACTSLCVSLATVWLWGRTAGAVPRNDAAPAIAVADPSPVAALPPVAAPRPEPALAPLLAQPIGRPVALAPIIAPIKPGFPALPAFLARPAQPARAARAARAARSSTVAPRPAAPVPTHFSVTSDPVGANVTINGVGYGPTPVTIPFLPPGAKRIRVTKAGYQSHEQVVGAGGAGSTPGVRIVLAELPGAQGSR